jgi:predicted nucleic acid-binding protein
VQPVLFDTTIYVAGLRRGDERMLATRRMELGSVLFLSAVVLDELYAGAGDEARPVVERLESDFERANRILVPNQNDWSRAGKVIERLAAKYDYERVGRGRLTNDALIAMSAARVGVRVITTNERDFRRLAEFRPFQFEVTGV